MLDPIPLVWQNFGTPKQLRDEATDHKRIHLDYVNTQSRSTSEHLASDSFRPTRFGPTLQPQPPF